MRRTPACDVSNGLEQLIISEYFQRSRVQAMAAGLVTVCLAALNEQNRRRADPLTSVGGMLSRRRRRHCIGNNAAIVSNADG
jgi:hypothetical protein